MTEIKYGVISDIHQDPRVIVPTLKILEEQGAEKLLVNGDVGGNYGSLEKSQQYTAFILDSIGKSGLEAYVQPGSHETISAFNLVLDHLSEKYENIFDCSRISQIKIKDHHQLIFLPGSDFLCGGEYQIGNHEQIPSGRYIQTQESLMPREEASCRIKPWMIEGFMQYANMNDLKKYVNDPDKTIVVCHVPRKFDNLETCVDVAEFGEVMRDFYLNKEGVKKGHVYSLPVAKQVIQTGAPVEIRKENRGNSDLKNLYEELGITKAVSGHFHESGHRANDRSGNHVPEGQLVSELFWNSGHLDIGQTGILTVTEGKVSYRNINLKDYLK